VDKRRSGVGNTYTRITAMRGSPALRMGTAVVAGSRIVPSGVHTVGHHNAKEAEE